MKVYYGTNFWGSPKEAEELEKISLNKEFIWDSLSGFVPAIYVGEQGIAVDICIRVSNAEVKDFYEKWRPKLHDQISEEERRQAQLENPLNIDFSLNIFVNGEKLENDFGCGTCYSSVIAKEYTTAHPGKEEQLMTEYSCDQNYAWYFKRHMCKWGVRSKKLETLEIEFISSNKELCSQQQNADYGEKPRRMQENSDGTVTVIGYIDGPTSVFLAGKQKDKEERIAFPEKEREDMTLYIAF